MKFLLTIYICSIVSQQCAEVPVEHDYKRFHNTHYSCVQKGLGESYAILFDGEAFEADQVETLELYARYSCQKVSNYQENEQSETTLPESKDL
jgi:hypothetical protein|tara:strand:- start:1245 stop:1523 length:279 start_codon:yes stop_codon:yes gene_type:complete